jgi:alcohol dehydrogenase
LTAEPRAAASVLAGTGRFVLDRAGFDVSPGARIVSGPGVVEGVGEVARALGLGRVLLVTDAGVSAAGHAERVRASLVAAGLEVRTYAAVRPEPTTLDVDRCLAVLEGEPIDGFVAVGGGSVIDAAKATAILERNGGRLEQYRGHGHPMARLRPIIAIPTTSGTGSETQSFALIADEESHAKMAFGTPSALPRAVLLDPALTLSLPRPVTAASGVDALVHALECAVTRARSPLSLVHAEGAFRLIVRSFARALDEPSDLAARGDMQLGAALAGLAIEESMLGATHAAANPLSARYGTTHGHAVGAMALAVLEWNAEDSQSRAAYASLAKSAGLALQRDSDAHAVAALHDSVAALLAHSRIPRLAQTGLERSDIPSLSSLAALQWTAGFNPRRVESADFERLYARALDR